MKNISELLGWYGVIAILTAYALLSFDILAPHSGAYHILNLTGAFGIMIDAYTDKNMQPVVLNIIWAGIAIFALLQIAL